MKYFYLSILVFTLSCVQQDNSSALDDVTETSENFFNHVTGTSGKYDTRIRPETFYLPSSYAVPVRNEELEPFAHFRGGESALTISGNQVEILYTLPPFLTGHASTVRMVGHGDSTGILQLQGDNGAMACSIGLDQNSLECKTQFENLPVDRARMREITLGMSSSWNEAMIREEVAESFITDPIGTLYIYAPMAK